MESLGSRDDERQPLLAGESKTLDQLIDAVKTAGAKKFSRWYPLKRSAAKKELRAAIDALKAHAMSEKQFFSSRGGESQLIQDFFTVMDQHFSQKDILDVLNYKKGGVQVNYGTFRIFSYEGEFELEANRPNVSKATQKIDRELFKQFPDITNFTKATGVINAINPLLFVHGLSTKSTDKNGSTLLHKVLEQLNPNMTDEEIREIFEYFQKNGADFNAQNKYGNTPLHIAARRRLVKLKAEEVLPLDQVSFGTQVQEVGDIVGGAVKILCEQFGVFPEIANNVLETPTAGGFGSDAVRSIRLGEYFDKHESSLHAAIERRDVESFQRLMEHYRTKQSDYIKDFQNKHPKFGLPIVYLQNLIKAYEDKKGLHSPRQWWRYRKLKSMMKYYLNNLEDAIRSDINNAFLEEIESSSDSDDGIIAPRKPTKKDGAVEKVVENKKGHPHLVQEVAKLSDANRQKLAEKFKPHRYHNNDFQRYLPESKSVAVVQSVGPSRAEAIQERRAAAAAEPVPQARVIVATGMVEVDLVAELQAAFRAFKVREQPRENLLTLLDALNGLSQKQITEVLNAEKSSSYFLCSSIQTDCNICRIKLWEYSNIWKAILKITEKQDQHAKLEQAVRGNFTTEVVRLINNRTVKIVHGANINMQSTLLKSAVHSHNVVVVELLLTHGAVVTFAEFRALFQISQGHDEYYLEEGKKVNELLQAKFALVQWPAKDIRTLLSDTYRNEYGYFNACELQAILSGLSRISAEDRESILNREIVIGGYGGKRSALRDCLQANCEKMHVEFPEFFLSVGGVPSVAYQAPVNLQPGLQKDQSPLLQRKSGDSSDTSQSHEPGAALKK